MELDPQALDIPDRYKLLIGGIVPRPIAFVSTLSMSDRLNLAPFSFFAGVSSNPMTILFCPANRPDGCDKDTLRNALPIAEGGRGEFVVNVASHNFAHQMSACAEELPFGESEFDLSGLKTRPSTRVAPPSVAESPLSYECVTQRVIRLNPGAPAGGNIIIGEVVWVHARDGLVNERRHVDPAMLDAIGRMGGMSYSTTRDRFEMPMGRKALES